MPLHNTRKHRKKIILMANRPYSRFIVGQTVDRPPDARGLQRNICRLLWNQSSKWHCENIEDTNERIRISIHFRFYVFYTSDLDEPDKPVMSVFLISKHWGSKPYKNRSIYASVDLRRAQKFNLTIEPLCPSQCNWIAQALREIVSCIRLPALKFCLRIHARITDLIVP